jgi:hypothetical protein
MTTPIPLRSPTYRASQAQARREVIARAIAIMSLPEATGRHGWLTGSQRKPA